MSLQSTAFATVSGLTNPEHSATCGNPEIPAKGFLARNPQGGPGKSWPGLGRAAAGCQQIDTQSLEGSRRQV